MKELKGIRVCMATTSHAADDDRIFFKEARSLAKAGAEVVILCAKDKDPPADRDGVQFINYDGGGGLKRRALTLRKLEQAIAAQDCHVIHCHEPDGLIAAIRLKRRTGAKVIFDSHEMWSAIFAERFPETFWPLGAAAYSRLERKLIAQCDAAIGASWAISDFLASVLGRERVDTILNVPVEEVFGEAIPRVWDDETTLCHDGHLTFNRGLKTMAEATRIVSARHKVVLKIVGDVFNKERDWLDNFVKKHKLERVIVRTGWLPYREVGKALSSCHIGLIALQKTPNNIVTSSNKVFNYLLYGIPFIGPEFRLSKQKLVREERCGVLADSASADSYAAAITRMIESRKETEEMGRRALLASKQRYRWEHMEPVLLDLYNRVLDMRQENRR